MALPRGRSFARSEGGAVQGAGKIADQRVESERIRIRNKGSDCRLPLGTVAALRKQVAHGRGGSMAILPNQ